MDNVLAEWLDKHDVPQCHVAETEKYAHVTFFFNGGTEAQYKREHRDMVDSPKVATYDLKPEMSAIGVAEKVKCFFSSTLQSNIAQTHSTAFILQGGRKNQGGQAPICHV